MCPCRCRVHLIEPRPRRPRVPRLIDIEDVPADLLALAIRVPDVASETTLLTHDLPAGWRRYPADAACARIGDEWVASGATLLLRVPSVIVPEESNVMINPAHAQAGEVRVESTRHFAFDPRLR